MSDQTPDSVETLVAAIAAAEWPSGAQYGTRVHFMLGPDGALYIVTGHVGTWALERLELTIPEDPAALRVAGEAAMETLFDAGWRLGINGWLDWNKATRRVYARGHRVRAKAIAAPAISEAQENTLREIGTTADWRVYSIPHTTRGRVYCYHNPASEVDDHRVDEAWFEANFPE